MKDLENNKEIVMQHTKASWIEVNKLPPKDSHEAIVNIEKELPFFFLIIMFGPAIPWPDDVRAMFSETTFDKEENEVVVRTDFLKRKHHVNYDPMGNATKITDDNGDSIVIEYNYAPDGAMIEMYCPTKDIMFFQRDDTITISG